MKRISFIAMLIIMMLPITTISADGTGTNPPVKEIKQMLTQEAQNHNIPPEVFKSIAALETGYQQFDENGEPIITDDGGIGIMQITPDNINLSDVDKEKLKNDIAYNIKIGAKVLDNKWKKNLPDINQNKRTTLENWYWPVAAYNGLSHVNDPNRHPDSAYQERVFERISSRAFLEGETPYFITPKFEVSYNDEGKLFLPDVKYKTYRTTPSRQMYNEGDTVYIDGRHGDVNFHQNTVNGPVKPLSHNTDMTIIDGPVEAASARNDFAYYHVDVNKETGYIASAYLNPEKEELTDFPDVNSWNYPEAVNYLAERNIIQGDENGNFNPTDNITREQAVRMLLKAMGRDFEHANPPDPGFNDAAPGSHPFPTVALGTNIGFISGKDENTFKPYGDLKRAHIAIMMVDAYDLEGDSDDNFTDVPESMKAHDSIHTLAANGIIEGYDNGTFKPWKNIERANFAKILYRYLTD